MRVSDKHHRNHAVTGSEAQGFLAPIPQHPVAVAIVPEVMQALTAPALLEHPARMLMFLALLFSVFAHALRRLGPMSGKQSKGSKGKYVRSSHQRLAPWDISPKPSAELAVAQSTPFNNILTNSTLASHLTMNEMRMRSGSDEVMDSALPSVRPNSRPSLLTSFLAYIAIILLLWAMSLLILISKCPDFLTTIVPYIVIPFALIIFIVTPMFYSLHLRRLVTRQLSPSNVWPLSHAVVLISKRTPLDKLTQAFQAVMQQSGTGLRPHVVLAVEAGDQQQEEAFEALVKIAGNHVGQLHMVQHSLTEMDLQGRPLARSSLARNLYNQLVREDGIDPFQVMVTFVDASALLSSNYLATVEEHFHRLPNGQRTIFSGSLNTYRGLAKGGILSQMYELMRCHESVFFNPMSQFAPQANYSTTLGFAAELNMWSSNSTDTTKAVCRDLQRFADFSAEPVETTIFTDPAQSFAERYDSATLQQWAVVECAWQAAIVRCIPYRFRETWTTLKAAMVQEISLFTCALHFCLFAMKMAAFSLLPLCIGLELPERLKYSFWFCIGVFVWQWIHFWGAEVWYWRKFMKTSPIVGPNIANWALLVICSPVLWVLAQVIFVIIPTFHCLVTAAIWGMTHHAHSASDQKKRFSDEAYFSW